VPMMCEHTPESIALLARFAPLAEHILGRAVLPCRQGRTVSRHHVLAP
jgi:hypothetical protein